MISIVITVTEKRTTKDRQKKAAKRIQYIIVTTLILLIILFLLYMFTPLSRISHVNISGNHNVSDSQVEKIKYQKGYAFILLVKVKLSII